MDELMMEVRGLDEGGRTVVGVVAPYDEVTYLTANPDGERIRRGAFKRSIDHHRRGVPLLRNHARDRVMGRSRAFTETADGLVGEFVVNPGDDGDGFLADIRHGYLDAMSVGFRTVRSERAADGVREIVEAGLVEVSMVAIPAYEGAAMLAVRSACSVDELLAPFANRPQVNLDPIPPLGYRPR